MSGDDLTWVLVHAYTGEVLSAAAQPLGIRGAGDALMRPLGSSGPWEAGRITPRATAVLAPNASWMTLDGTNSWLLVEPGSDRAVLVDPGPDDPGHLAALVGAAEELDARIALILLTHGHADHSAGARSLHDLTGAPVRALDPAHRLGDEGLGDGERGVRRRPRAVRGRDTGAHRRQPDVPAARRRRPAHRGHGPGTRQRCHSPPRWTSGRLPGLPGPAGRPRRAAPGPGGSCPGTGRPAPTRRACWPTTSSTAGSAWRSCPPRWLPARPSPTTCWHVVYPEVPPALRWAARLSLAAQVEYLTDRAPGLTGAIVFRG